MKLSLRQLLFSASLLSFVPFIQAQQPLGLVVGDYNTPYAVSINPAMVAGQRRTASALLPWHRQFQRRRCREGLGPRLCADDPCGSQRT